MTEACAVSCEMRRPQGAFVSLPGKSRSCGFTQEGAS